MSLHRWKKISSHVDHDHRIFALRRDVVISPRTGVEHEFLVLQSQDWVLILAMTEDGEVVLVHQYRHGLGDFTVEMPGGLVDDRFNPEEAARAELREETGFGAGTWTYLGRLAVVPAVFDNSLHVFLARGVRRISEVDLDEGEDILTELVSLEEVRARIADGRLVHAPVVAAMYLYDQWMRVGSSPSTADPGPGRPGLGETGEAASAEGGEAAGDETGA